jgi:uncharacterized protein YcnI
MVRWVRRFGAAVVGVVAALAVTGVAYAHVEVEAEPAVGGAAAVVTFSAEAVSPSSGIKSVQIILPAGLSPADVSLQSGPAGWTLTPTSDGYIVAGPALPKGRDAEHAIKVKALPNQAQVVFKALVTYTDNTVDRWIEEPSTANPNPNQPAPILKLTPGPSPTPAPTTEPPATVAATTPPVTANATPIAAEGGLSPFWWIIIVAFALIAAAAIAMGLRKRRANADQ